MPLAELHCENFVKKRFLGLNCHLLHLFLFINVLYLIYSRIWLKWGMNCLYSILIELSVAIFLFLPKLDYFGHLLVAIEDNKVISFDNCYKYFCPILGKKIYGFFLWERPRGTTWSCKKGSKNGFWDQIATC